MTEPTDQHKQQARETPGRIGLHPATLETGNGYIYTGDDIESGDAQYVRADILSSRDSEIKNVLEGLRFRHGCWCELPPNVTSPDHTNECDDARALWEKVQPKGSSDVTE